MKRKKLDHNHLAEGEHTGHFHAAHGGTLFMEDDALICENEAEMEVTHQEHHTQIIPPSPTGEYRIGRIVEVDPFDKMERQVVD